MESGAAGDALAAVNRGDVAADEGAGGKHDLTVMAYVGGEFGGEDAVFGGGFGIEGLAEAGVEKGAAVELVGAGGDFEDDFAVGGVDAGRWGGTGCLEGRRGCVGRVFGGWRESLRTGWRSALESTLR